MEGAYPAVGRFLQLENRGLVVAAKMTFAMPVLIWVSCSRIQYARLLIFGSHFWPALSPLRGP